MNSIIEKLYAYSKELSFIVSNAKGLKNKCSLLLDTMKFHLSNKNHLHLNSPAKKYQISLNGQDRDVWLRTHAGDIFVFYEIFLEKCYYIPKEWLGDVRNIIDLGANIGMTTLYYQSYLFPKANYICVEASKQNVKILKDNVSYNSSIRVIDGAINWESGTVNFDDTQAAWGGAITTNSNSTTVRAYSIPELCNTYSIDTIDILKIDIEGGELGLLTKNTDWLHKVRCIIIEIHYPYMTIELLKEKLSPYGFVLVNQSPEHGVKMICAFSVKNTNFNPNDEKIRPYIL
jgi:FkbM family methyltransferase